MCIPWWGVMWRVVKDMRGLNGWRESGKWKLVNKSGKFGCWGEESPPLSRSKYEIRSCVKSDFREWNMNFQAGRFFLNIILLWSCGKWNRRPPFLLRRRVVIYSAGRASRPWNTNIDLLIYSWMDGTWVRNPFLHSFSFDTDWERLGDH